jgi:hypothetical protein
VFLIKLQRGMDKYNGKTNPHRGLGITGGVQATEESWRSIPGPGWSEEARGEIDAQRAVTSGCVAERGEGLLEYMERTGRIELAGQGPTWGSGEQQCSG